jgi:DNA-binding NarL/FixJ family response regulator
MADDSNIVRALEQIARVLTGIVLRDLGEGDQIKKIARLKSCGLQNAEIARMLGTTANTVNVTVHSLKNKKKVGSRASKVRERSAKRS